MKAIIVFYILLFLNGDSLPLDTGFIYFDRIEGDLFIAFDASDTNGFFEKISFFSEVNGMTLKSFDIGNNYPLTWSYSLLAYGPGLNKENVFNQNLSEIELIDRKTRIQVFQGNIRSTEYRFFATLDKFNNRQENNLVGCQCYGIVEFLEYTFETSIEEDHEKNVVCLNIFIPTEYGVANLMISTFYNYKGQSELILWGKNKLDRIHVKPMD